MPPIARRLFTDHDDMTHFTPPALPVDPVVKLVAHVHGLEPKEGSGFLLPRPTPAYIIFTARHVVRPYGRSPYRVDVVTSDNRRFRAASFAHPNGDDDDTDGAVVLTWRDMQFLAAGVGSPPATSFSAIAKGYPSGEWGTRTQPLTAVTANGTYIQFPASPVRTGMSGGPIIASDEVVGCLTRETEGLALFRTTWLSACIEAANAAIGGAT